jgi:copper(I)-binding protein
VIRSSLAAARPSRLLVLAIAALAVTSCEAGNNAPVEQWHPPTDGAYQTFGNIAVSDAFVLGAPIGQTVPAGGSAGLFLALYNSGSPEKPPEKLVSISAPGVARSVTLPGGSVRLASQRSVLLTGPAPEIILNDLVGPLKGGSSIRLVLTFQDAGTVGIQVPVMPRARYYSPLSPPPSPSPSASARAAASPGATASPSATASPAASPSPSPSATP